MVYFTCLMMKRCGSCIDFCGPLHYSCVLFSFLVDTLQLVLSMSQCFGCFNIFAIEYVVVP